MYTPCVVAHKTSMLCIANMYGKYFYLMSANLGGKFLKFTSQKQYIQIIDANNIPNYSQ